MRTVREILNKKGNLIWSVTPDASVYEALQLMAEKEAGAVLVIENGKIKGILSERDYARKVVLHGKFSKDTRDRKSTRLNSSHLGISYAVFCLKKKINKT